MTAASLRGVLPLPGFVAFWRTLTLVLATRLVETQAERAAAIDLRDLRRRRGVGLQHSNEFRLAQRRGGEGTEGQRDDTCFARAAMYYLGRARRFLAPARTELPRQASRCQRARDLVGPLSLGDWWDCH